MKHAERKTTPLHEEQNRRYAVHATDGIQRNEKEQKVMQRTDKGLCEMSSAVTLKQTLQLLVVSSMLLTKLQNARAQADLASSANYWNGRSSVRPTTRTQVMPRRIHSLVSTADATSLVGVIGPVEIAVIGV